MSVFTNTKDFFMPVLSVLLATISHSDGDCRYLRINGINRGKALVNHTVDRIQPTDQRTLCASKCYLEPLCFSYNFCEDHISGSLCELLDSDHIRHGEHLVDKEGCTYYGSETSCSSNPCANNATCQGDFSGEDKPYRCVCPQGFTGRKCEIDIDECATAIHHQCHVNAICTNAIGGYNCTCKDGFYGNGKTCEAPETCQELKSRFLPHNSSNGYYALQLVGGGVGKVFCSYESYYECGAGPWTLAMKIDGSKENFQYESVHWSQKSVFNPDGSVGGLDREETVSPAYWTTPLTKLCLGMRYNNTLNWILINVTASSLYDIMTNQMAVPTYLGEAKWRSLLPKTTLQPNCNMEGFNLACLRRLRLGYFRNDQKDCRSCNSYIGLGSSDARDKEPVCGNYGSHVKLDNGQLNIPAFCYILIQ